MDTEVEAEVQEEEGVTDADANSNEEGASSSTKKARVDINAVHKEYKISQETYGGSQPAPAPTQHKKKK